VRRLTWLSGSADGPCCRTTASQRPDASTFGASPIVQWSSMLQPPGASILYSTSGSFDAAPSPATTAGRSFTYVRLLPTKRTRTGARFAAFAEPPVSTRAIAASAATALARYINPGS
jgi:hypothetical protein